MLFSRHKTKMVMPTEALPGREQPAFAAPERHAVLGTPLEPPFPEGLSTSVFGLGCFWGAERKFWQIDDVYTTAVGFTPNSTYEEVCSGRTGHTGAVLENFLASGQAPYFLGDGPVGPYLVENDVGPRPTDLLDICGPYGRAQHYDPDGRTRAP